VSIFKDFWISGIMPMQLLFVLTGAAILYVVVNYYLKKAGKGITMFGQSILIFLGALFILQYVVYPPLPIALIYTYMGLIAIVIFLLVSADDKSFEEFKAPILKTLRNNSGPYKNARLASFVILPLAFGYGTFDYLNPKYEEPIELRTVHPAPPASVKVSTFVDGKKTKFTLQTARNPFRLDDEGEYSEEVQVEYQNGNPWADDASQYLQYVREGGSIFFQNCHFCHGDNLDGRGMFSFAFNPIPANFTDSGTIAQLQETFVLWRVAKGGPGLPQQSFPWASAMPAWEQHLTTDEMWKVILFEYWKTGYYPRTWE